MILGGSPTLENVEIFGNQAMSGAGLYAYDADPVLINDLDLRIVDPGGVTNYPFVLDPGSPAAAAGYGDNRLDNVEQVLIDTPLAEADRVAGLILDRLFPDRIARPPDRD